MVTTPLAIGDVLPLVREVTASPDPLALYHRLSDGGRRAGTFLLESAETGAGAGERSLIGIGSALRITCAGRIVSVEALSANGRSILPWIAERLAEISRSSFAALSVTTEAGIVTAAFPRPPEGQHDEAARGKLLSPLEVLRSIVFGVRLLAHPIDACHLAAGVFSYDLVEHPTRRARPAEGGSP